MINHCSLTIALVAGETSGDILGSGLILALKKKTPNTRFIGVAGPKMREAGCEVLYDMEELEVLGIVEVFGKLYRLINIYADLTRRLISLRPDVFIGIDSPEFNIPLEKKLKKNGIKTIHYVSPSIWAWRKKRILKIKKSTHKTLLILPFEKKIYEKFQVSYCFIGHRIADIMPLNPDKKAARRSLGIPLDIYCIALLPGSRKIEVKMLSAVFLKTAKILRNTLPNLEVLVPLVNENRRREFENIKSDIAPNFQIRLLNGKSREAMTASDATLLASGTATLECMFAKCPMVVGYRMKPFNYWLIKHLVKTNYISLPNLLAGREIVKEFLQKECNPISLSKILLFLLTNKKIQKQIQEKFLELHKKIRCNADQQAARIVLELAGKRLK